jgi:hypothetical protein
MNTCPNCGKVEGLHSSILQGCMCQYSMQAPPQRSESSGKPSAWVGLTDEEILDNCESVPDYDISNHDLIQFARAIEAKLREKNSQHKEKNT